MTGREALEDIRRTDSEIAALLDYRNSLLDRLLSGYDPSRTPVQEAMESKVERSALRWMELTEEIDKKTDQLIAKRDMVLYVIDNLKDRRHREILRRRYAECQPWDKVAELCMYSRHRVWELHKEAVEAFETIYGGLKL
jgi:DNA-directed RNA polymerase specialized sigma subunit